MLMLYLGGANPGQSELKWKGSSKGQGNNAR